MSRRTPWLVALGFAAAALLLYARAFAVQRYGDDLGFLLPPPINPLFHFAAPHPQQPWYRPIEAMVFALVQNGFGLAVWPLHLVALTLHVGLALLVRQIAWDLGLDERAAWLAAVWFLVAQVGVMAVASGDTLSQQCSALGVTAMAWLLRRGFREGDARTLGLSCLAAALALWGKETGVAVVPVALVIAAPQLKAQRRRTLGVLAGLALLAAVYWLCREHASAAEPQLGEKVYGFQLGLNIPRNVVFLWGASLSSVSTVRLVQWLQLGPHWAFALAMLPAAGLGFWTLYAWRDRRRLLLGLVVLSGVSLLPMILLHHVSELYTYQALPWLSILVGYGLARAWPAGRGTIVGLLLLAQIVGVEGKLDRMGSVGQRTASYLEQLRPIVAEMPAGGRLILVDELEAGWRYGVFSLPGLQVFIHGLDGLPVVLGRSDLQYHLNEPEEVSPPRPGDVLVGVSEDGTTLRRLAWPMEMHRDP